VTLLHAGTRLLEAQLDEARSEALHEHFHTIGVDVRLGCDVRAIMGIDGRIVVRTTQAELGPFDGAIVATGFTPRVALAKDAGLATARGIVVNDYLRTADPAIYAIGDVAEVGGRTYAFVSPIRSQALWLAQHLTGETDLPWTPPRFTPTIKVHGFKPVALAAAH